MTSELVVKISLSDVSVAGSPFSVSLVSPLLSPSCSVHGCIFRCLCGFCLLQNGSDGLLCVCVIDALAPSQSKATGDGLMQATVGEAATFIVQVLSLLCYLLFQGVRVFLISFLRVLVFVSVVVCGRAISSTARARLAATPALCPSQARRRFKVRCFSYLTSPCSSPVLLSFTLADADCDTVQPLWRTSATVSIRSRTPPASQVCTLRPCNSTAKTSAACHSRCRLTQVYFHCLFVLR